jgi:ACS family tartrate transporter-like MFS transporter
MSSQILNASDRDGERAVSIATWRLMPFLFLAMVVNFMDRINVGYAALKMNADTGISPSMYGIGASIFFVGYILFEVPSNLAMEKFGARIWLARIMISWGIISGCMSLIVGPQSFYLLRFLLGAAEAGFFPGVILYLTYWFPHSHRARIIGMFMVAMPVAGIISAPISVYLLSLDGFMGLKGWQNMYIFEAALAVVLGIISYSYLPDRPTSAKWLSPTQKSALLKMIGIEPVLRKITWQTRLKTLFCSVDVLLMSVIFFCMLSGLYAISFWLPQIVKGLGLSIKEVGMVAAIPFIVAAIAMVTWSRISDSHGNRVRHLVGTSVAASLGFIIAAVFSKSPPGIIVGLSIALAGALAAGPIFWAYATSILKGEWSAPSIAIVTSLGTLGGVVTPAYIGFVKEISGEFAISLASLALIPGIGIIAALWLCARQKQGRRIGASLEETQHIPSIITS